MCPKHVHKSLKSSPKTEDKKQTEEYIRKEVRLKIKSHPLIEDSKGGSPSKEGLTKFQQQQQQQQKLFIFLLLYVLHECRLQIRLHKNNQIKQGQPDKRQTEAEHGSKQW